MKVFDVEKSKTAWLVDASQLLGLKWHLKKHGHQGKVNFCYGSFVNNLEKALPPEFTSAEKVTKIAFACTTIRQSKYYAEEERNLLNGLEGVGFKIAQYSSYLCAPTTIIDIHQQSENHSNFQRGTVSPNIGFAMGLCAAKGYNNILYVGSSVELIEAIEYCARVVDNMYVGWFREFLDARWSSTSLLGGASANDPHFLSLDNSMEDIFGAEVISRLNANKQKLRYEDHCGLTRI